MGLNPLQPELKQKNQNYKIQGRSPNQIQHKWAPSPKPNSATNRVGSACLGEAGTRTCVKLYPSVRHTSLPLTDTASPRRRDSQRYPSFAKTPKPSSLRRKNNSLPRASAVALTSPPASCNGGLHRTNRKLLPHLEERLLDHKSPKPTISFSRFSKVPPISTPKKIPNTSTFDSQGCILLDHEGSEPSREVTTVPSISVVTVNTPTDSFTENVHVSSTPLETAQVTLVTAVTDEKEPPPSTVMSVTPNEEICEQFDVAEPFVGNVDHVVNNSNSSPSFVPFAHNNLFAVLDSADANDPSSVPPAMELVISNSPIPFTFASHDTSPAPQDPPLNPSQRFKEMEWFTVTGKEKRSRGGGPHR
ncbi:hypothetical protein Bca52824_009205 [Brassica carinata]|uniref:Uncharacterized protein n=1 Tax=Brassica carinata TaxID=52824 RepID=A0A8X7WBT8_BRACI|nr:hypothetical protein Bca52824_009205 [Brassica carinata]